MYETAGAAVRFRLGRYFALSPIYQFVATQYYPGIHTRENRLSINGVVSVPIKWLVLGGMAISVSRCRLLFAWDEAYYDRIPPAWSRNRFAAGGGKRLNSKLTIDLYFLKQNARFSRPRNINAIGVTFRIQLDRPIHHLP